MNMVGISWGEKHRWPVAQNLMACTRPAIRPEPGVVPMASRLSLCSVAHSNRCPTIDT